MSDKPIGSEQLHIAEQIAIACTCLGTAVVIALFLLQKTPLIVVTSVVLIFVLTIYPIWVFAPRLGKPTRAIGIVALGILCLFLAVYVWPDTDPISDIVVDQAVIRQPYVVGQSPTLNVDYFNYSPHTIKAKIFGTLSVRGGFSSLEDEHNTEESIWNELVRNVSSATDTIDLPFTPRAKTWNSLESSNVVLNQQQFDNLQAGNSNTYVFWAFILFYKDSSGEHELDYCSFGFDRQVIHLCRNHNGPVEPMKHSGFSFPSRWNIF